MLKVTDKEVRSSREPVVLVLASLRRQEDEKLKDSLLRSELETGLKSSGKVAGMIFRW